MLEEPEMIEATADSIETQPAVVEEASAEESSAIEVVRETMDKFLDTASVEKAYGRPIRRENHTIIPTAEVLTVMGFGSGFGANQQGEGGGGGGGGGRTLSRPVVVIIASPEGVRVEPVVDLTKIALAALTAAGFMLTTLMRMRHGG